MSPNFFPAKSMPGTKKEVPKERDRPTQRVGFWENRRESSEKEIVLVVWKFKDIGSCGHAALKLRKRNENDKKFATLDYISWWPKTADFIDTPKLQVINSHKVLAPLIHFQPKEGEGHKNYLEDETEELSGDKKIAIFLSYIYRAADNTDYEDGIQDLFKRFWSIGKGSNQDEWRAMGFSENFGNMSMMINTGKISLRVRQKMVKGSRYRDEKTRKFNEQKLRDDFENGNFDEKNMLEGFKIVKLPDVKTYLPGAELVLKSSDKKSPYKVIWGLSFDAIRYSWKIFQHNSNPHWQMITNQVNCASVAWNRLMDGYADALLEGKTGDLIAKLQKLIYIQPNNIVEIGERLTKALNRLNEQQAKIDAATQKHYQKIRPLAQSGKMIEACETLAEKVFNKNGIATKDKKIKKNEYYYLSEKGNLWPAMLQYPFWKEISKTNNLRPPALKKVDDALKNFQKDNGKMDRYEEHRLIEGILQHEEKYLSLTDSLSRARDFGKPDFEIKALEEKIDATRETMKFDFNELTKCRHDRVQALVKLHNAIFHYVESAREDDERLPRVLFLGQCAACAFAETMQYGVYVILTSQTDSFYAAPLREIQETTGAIVNPTVKIDKMNPAVQIEIMEGGKKLFKKK